MNLVPAHEPLVAEVAIENRDVGFVAPGQPVRIKVAAYPFHRYGMIAGTVRTISADATGQGQGLPAGQGATAPVFKARIELDRQQLGTGDRELPVVAGMQVTAEIVQGRRTVLDYLLSPVQRVMDEAGRER